MPSARWPACSGECCWPRPCYSPWTRHCEGGTSAGPARVASSSARPACYFPIHRRASHLPGKMKKAQRVRKRSVYDEEHSPGKWAHSRLIPRPSKNTPGRLSLSCPYNTCWNGFLVRESGNRTGRNCLRSKRGLGCLLAGIQTGGGCCSCCDDEPAAAADVLADSSAFGLLLVDDEAEFESWPGDQTPAQHRWY